MPFFQALPMKILSRYSDHQYAACTAQSCGDWIGMHTQRVNAQVTDCACATSAGTTSASSRHQVLERRL